MDYNKSVIAEQANIFKALGHPARLLMACLLREGEKSVGELTEAVDLDMSTVSKHLAVLKAAHIVTTSKQGNTVHYKLELTCLDNFLNCTYSSILSRIEQKISFIKN